MPTSQTWHQTIALAALLLIGSVGVVRCGSGGGDESGGGAGAIEVKTSPLSIVITNRSGRALTGVKITLQAGLLSFIRTHGRLESGERREFSLSEFRAREGTGFDPRFHKVKAVRVTGADADGKTVEVQVPWR